jgi:hypothetical protein
MSNAPVHDSEEEESNLPTFQEIFASVTQPINRSMERDTPLSQLESNPRAASSTAAVDPELMTNNTPISNSMTGPTPVSQVKTPADNKNEG